MSLLRFLCLAGLSSALFWLGYYAWWPAIVPAAAALGLAFCERRTVWTCVGAAIAGGFIAWRPLQDSLTAYGPVGIHILLVFQAVTLIPVALSLRWGWQRGLRMVWFFPLVWIGGEFLRMLGPIGFPFCALALPVYEQLWLIQIADLGGLHLVSAVLAMVSGLLLDIWKNIRPGGQGLAWRRLRAPVIACLLVLLFVGGYGSIRLHQIENNLQPGPVIAVVQPDIPLTANPEGDYDGELLLRELQAMTEEAARAIPRPQLIVWPEAISAWPLHSPEYFNQPFAASLFPEIAAEGTDLTHEELALNWDAQRADYRRKDAALRAWVRDLGIPLLFGQVVRLPVAQEGGPILERYNAARLIRPQDDNPLERQMKVRLFPGGEYVPGGRERFRTLTGVSEYFAEYVDSIANIKPGTERELFHLPPVDAAAADAAPIPFLVSICGEVLFPESSGVFDFPNVAPIHVTIANEGRFQRNRAQLIPYMTLPFRAVEARRGIARSANTGVSGFVSPTGELYGQVVNAEGKYWTGLGFAERVGIQAFETRAREFARNPADARLKAELADLSEEIRRLRAEAGVTGISVARVDISPHGSLYQRNGNLFAWFTIFALFIATLAACLRRPSRCRVETPASHSGILEKR